MNYLATTLAWRYLTQNDQNNRMKLMLAVCFIGIFIGSFALCLVLAVMNGFQQATYKALKNINAELEMHAFGEEIAASAIAEIIKKEFPEITGSSPYDIRQGLVFTPYDASPAELIMIKAIEPSSEETVSAIKQKIIDPQKSALTTLLQDNHVLIGKDLAQTISARIGDSLTIHFTHQTTRAKNITLTQKTVIISGIFFTGIDEFDNNLIICNFPTLIALFPDAGPTHLGLSIISSTPIEPLKTRLKERFSLEVIAWQDRYPAVVAALHLEKMVMFFILMLITLVASTNIIALLSMHIASKRTDIAILRTMGIPLSIIKRIFIYFGLILSALAALVGITGATMMSMLINRYPCIQLPDSYYVTTLPSHMSIDIAMLVFFVVMCVTCCALAIATRLVHTIHITHVLRFEG